MGPSRMIWPSLAMLSYSWIAARRYRSSTGLTAAASRPKVPWGEEVLAGAEADGAHTRVHTGTHVYTCACPAWLSPPALAQAHMGAGGAVPQVSDLTQVLRQVILVLSLGSQLQVSAERIQPHRVGPADGVGLGEG